MLEPQQLSRLFPFHFLVDGEGRLIGVGESLARIAPEAQPGVDVNSCFEIERPRILLTAEDLAAHEDDIVLIRVRDHAITLRGQVMMMNGGFGFFGSPWIQDLGSLRKTGLTLRDFALHNPVPDYLTLLRSSQASMNDAVRLADKLKAARDAAEKADRAKSEFLAIMSHEIRTPLNVVLGITELLGDTELTPDQAQFVRTIHNNSELLRVLISDILDVSKMEAGQLELESTPFDLVGLLKDVADGLATHLHNRGLLLLVDISPSLPAAFTGDPSRMRQVVMNLVGNAVKFTKTGHVRLLLSGKPTEGSLWDVTLEVEDTGIGIPKDAQEKIFERFVQGASDTNRRFGGTGLGLNITRSLVELMGGTIEVSSEEGRGSTFSVHLPMKRAEQLPPLSRASVPPRSKAAQNAARSILLIEDNPDNQLLLSHILKGEGYRVTIANNGEEGVAVATGQGEYDLIISDIEMPKLDGFACATAIRSFEAEKKKRPTPILALTAHALKGYREKCLASGMNDYLTKPVKRKTLTDAIDSILRPKNTTLIVDDFPDSRLLLEHFLELHGGTQIISAETGSEGIEQAKREAPDLVLLDVDLPDHPGWKVAEEIARVSPHTHIVILSGHDDQEIREKCTSAGAKDYLVKPVSKARVHELLDRFLSSPISHQR